MIKLIFNFLEKYKKIIFFLVFLYLIFNINISFAAETASNSGGEKDFLEKFGIFDIFNLGIVIISGLLGLVTQFAAMFLDPAWTNGSFFGFDKTLKELWVMVSNFVYIIFAFLLILIAVMNILGKGGEWELKQALPRFIGGILIVPFSWFLVNALISLGSILMATFVSLPYDSFPKEFGKIGEFEVCTNTVVNFGDAQKDGGQLVECTEKKTLQEILEKGESLGTIISVYTYGIIGFEDGGKIFNGSLEEIKKVPSLLVKVLVDVLFIAIYFILMVALMIALFMRGVFIWLYLVFSPVFGLVFFFNGKGGKALEKFKLGDFVHLALIPAYVGAALSFGLLFILIAGKGMASTNEEGQKVFTEQGDTATFNYGEFKLSIKGDLLGQSNETKKTISELLLGTKSAIGLLIMQVLGVMVLWMAVMAALKSSTITEKAVQPISQFGESMGNLAMKAPSYLPIIPAPGGGTMSATALGGFGSQMYSDINSKFANKGSKIYTDLFGGNDITKSLSELRNSVVDLNKAIQNPSLFQKEILPKIKLLDNKDLSQTDYNLFIKELKRKGFLSKDFNVNHGQIRTPEGKKKLYDDLSKTTQHKLKVHLGESSKKFIKIMESDNKTLSDNNSNDDTPSPTPTQFKIDLNNKDGIPSQYNKNHKNDKDFVSKIATALSANKDSLKNISEETYKNALVNALNTKYGNSIGNNVNKIAEEIIKELKKQ